ncbi:TIGR03086 family metal-binding protein [Gandjariella thermophila]|uniref:TIGR03086 family protein n=1 Tax=Gandjariella thermophila TaxID=1931992 RepID=A0A4D4JGB4_9PSEU|nr:TIGR03086 family metal-binding protein [Gandjariella thermophila]GDY32937.1 TIGR03086 family protein [Gandjariella thermophila]
MTRNGTMLDLGPAAGQLTTMLGNVTDEHLLAPTPCAEYRVADLLGHLMGLTMAFRWAATRSTPTEEEGQPGVSAAGLDPEWRHRLPVRLDLLVAAWRDPAAWTGVTEVGGVTLPGTTAGGFALNELVLHGWDLARATGQPFHCDPEVAEASLRFTAAVVEQGFPAYGPPVDVPDDAPVVHRLLALAGRDPDWAA